MSNEGEDNVYAQERARAMAQRWATPGADPFEQWYWKLQRYFNRKVDPEIQDIYRKLLGNIDIPELEAVFEEYIMRADTGRDPPKVNQIYAMWKERKEKQRGRIRAKQAKPQRDVLEERDELRHKMYPMVCQALLGKNQYWQYTGEAPEWMFAIAAWAGDQFRGDHPGMLVHEIGDNQRQTYFDQALKLFDEERINHE